MASTLDRAAVSDESGGAAAARWAKVVDHESCIGCHACSTACKSENEVPLGVHRTYVKYVDVGLFPQVRRSFQVTRCNQCADAPCTHACPTTAMYARPDGIVDFDKDVCIGCKACIAACPYDAIFINPEDHTAEKCNFCAHRIDVGLEPACVVVCPTEAIAVGDLNDRDSRVAQTVYREPVSVRRPEKETHPKLFYRGAHQATLDPLAAERPAGEMFLWSEQTTGAGRVVSGSPADAPGSPDGRGLAGNSSAAAVLAYDVPHKAPWDWRVSLYTLTKGVAAGAYLAALLLVASGAIPAHSALWVWAAPIVGAVFLALTGLLLIWDLDKPARFYLIFTRPHWRSWLVRGAFAIAGYSVVLGLHLLAGLAGRAGPQGWIAVVGVPLAVLTAVYTAYLFAQSKARDLWQSPLLPPHLLVQSLLAGGAALLPLAFVVEPSAVLGLTRIVGIGAAVHLLLVLGEVTLPHATAHARLASWEMTSGRFRAWFRASLVLVALAAAAPWPSMLGVLGTLPPAGSAGLLSLAALAALAGLLAYEHAYVQAGQAVPLA